MRRTTILLLVGLLMTAVAPAGAVGGSDAGTVEQVDECKNSDRGPGPNGGPPGFVGGLVPDFLGDLLGTLPVPGFLQSWVGASAC